MKATHMLDLTGVPKMPEWWPKNAPSKLPLVVSAHCYDWDLVKSEIDPTVYKALVEAILGRGDRTYPPSAHKKPIGFRNRSIPKGAKIEAL